ncbi:hypothetical protein GCM10023107_47290 [Actinoplanes octamycinicus]
MMRRLLPLLLVLAGLAGCGARAEAGGRLPIVAAFYPLQFVSERVGGDLVQVVNLTKPGAEPHDVELSPRQVARIVDARVAVYLHGFQPAVDAAIAQNAERQGYDVSGAVSLLHADEAEGQEAEGHEGHDHGDEATDPHVWLDPVRLAAIGDGLAERLATTDPAHAADYRAGPPPCTASSPSWTPSSPPAWPPAPGASWSPATPPSTTWPTATT